MFRIVFYRPEIPPNTGNAIRLAANTGSELHLVEPLGFSLDAKRLRRAGLDYGDLTSVRVHATLDAALAACEPAAVYAFSAEADRGYATVAFEAGDVLLFGPESAGLPHDVLHHPRVTDRLRVPMAPGSRALNLANAASIAVYEAWRQHGFTGATGGR
ncbi:MAG: tRNA (cytidine(34)-2'-O)-methyltransferase [Thermocrispum sp.]